MDDSRCLYLRACCVVVVLSHLAASSPLRRSSRHSPQRSPSRRGRSLAPSPRTLTPLDCVAMNSCTCLALSLRSSGALLSSPLAALSLRSSACSSARADYTNRCMLLICDK